MGGPVNSEDEFRRADRAAKRDGRWLVAIVIGAAALGLVLRWWVR
ncbi:hypothetical protein [Bosea sp. TND4EK4]|nr:hypothetical protein [Bosea sp. TND4EK4]SIP95087.1 hypothetical protein SAMN05880592_101299 [Bosea sp. TND4EK4]